MKRVHYTAAALALALAGVLFWWLTRPQTAPHSTFVLLDGSKITTTDLRGRVTLVNFWATSCVPCLQEMPNLSTTFEKYRGSGFDTVAVSMSYDPPTYVVNYAQRHQLPFKVAIDLTGEIAHAWGDVQVIPTSYLLDRQGRVAAHYEGALDLTRVNQTIEQLLGRP